MHAYTIDKIDLNEIKCQKIKVKKKTKKTNVNLNNNHLYQALFVIV